MSIDTTEGIGPVTVGYTDPNEQTGSEYEHTPLVVGEYEPLRIADRTPEHGRALIHINPEQNSAGFRSAVLRIKGHAELHYDFVDEALRAADAILRYDRNREVCS